MPHLSLEDCNIGGYVVPVGTTVFVNFLPFGSGRRMCPGMNFALALIELMLVNLVYHFDWEMPRGVKEIDMTEVFGLTVHQKDKLILTPRLSCVAQPLEG
ncbi:hypothetical protein HU200_036106 [Digitaria exilis]|uniref:Cytochrome P450 n=1 Tax=Digitaria exilis TaxID=1010633 RepID=A0A835BSK4_9POAL|nr:hypothetical protein HU200_036106 [Digitaria exilis]